MNSENELLEKSLADLENDFEEMQYISNSSLWYLGQIKLKYISKEYQNLYQYFKKSYQICNIILNRLKIICRQKKSLINYNKLVAEKNRFYNLIRQKQVFLGSLITSGDFQSPSYLHSRESQAGQQTGKIIGTINDYKRDVHLDESYFEKKYMREYIDANWKILTHCYLVNSGLSAFTTILTFLLAEGKLKGQILLGKSSYFQYKQILSKILGKNIIEFSESDNLQISKLIEKKQPRAVFVDSLCNSKQIPVVNIELLMNCLNRHAKSEVFLIVDNTCLSVFCQPFRILLRNKNIHVITFESLNKYVQFGLDRVTGGIVTAMWKDGHKIFEYRKHAGTNISDSSVYAIPLPDRKLFERRLLRHQRNAVFLCSYLQNSIDSKIGSPIDEIIYPKLTNHVGYSWTKDMKFAGSFLNLKFKKKFENKKQYQRFIKLAIHQAKKNKVDLIAGTSFGLNTSRIYLTSLWTDYGDPFIRISAGTEDFLSIRNLAKILVDTIESFSKNKSRIF